MLRIPIAILVVLIVAGVAAAQKKPLPQFKDYPAPEKFSGKPAHPKLTSKRARLFRTNVRTQTAEGPNFAGHFRIVIWGCGAGCAQFAIVDVKSGDVYFPPEAETVMIHPDQDEDPLRYRLDSRLLILTGRKERPDWRYDGDGVFYYQWKDNRLVLLRKLKRDVKED